ncbi:MAG: HAMP domain-containing histidine kinase [Bacteroidales bacterium]|nr:HAMP domain-containing histidine kinase [Bacteroidales bacterium]
MASGSRTFYHKRLFLFFLGFLWAIVLCFIGFQYIREKQYKQEFLSAQLQLYNRNLICQVDEGLLYEEYIESHVKPFEELRISVVSLSGAVVYDNLIPLDSLNNHLSRPEIVQALKKGQGYHIGRYSESDGRLYFYSATKGERAIVRTAIPYSASLKDMLKADWTFLGIMIAISVFASVLAYFASIRLGATLAKLNRLHEEEEKNRLKRQLTNNINHELKTPVASMQVCLETLLNGIQLTDAKKMELIERCYVNNARLSNLLRDVSLITRLEDGSQLIGKEEVLLNGIIEEIKEELEVVSENGKMILHASFNEEVVINGNLSLIGAIFRNLTENAIAYSEGRNIYITLLENTPDSCSISFEDDGRGVDPEKLPFLFDRFYRIDKGRSRRIGGTGLGLSIVKHAVQFHGGKISVTNRAGGGLRFVFTLKK